jgi:signal transduction histidine kinase
MVETSLDLSRCALPAVAVDERGVVLEASPAFAALLGTEPSSLPGSALPSYVAESERAAFVDALRRAFDDGEPLDEVRSIAGGALATAARLTVVPPTAGARPARLLLIATPRGGEDGTLGGALDRMSDGFLTLDPTWHYTHVNRYAEWYLDTPREALLGRTLWEAFPAVRGTAQEAALVQAMASRAPVEFEQTSLLRPGTFHFRAFPGADGLSIYFREVTEAKAMEERMHALADSADVFARAASFEARLQMLTQLLVPRIADHCVVDLVEPRGLIRAAVAHRDPAVAARLTLQLGRPVQPCARRTLERRECEHVEVVTGEWLRAALDEDWHDVVTEVARPRSAILAPLLAGDVAVGVLSLARSDPRRSFRATDVPFVRLLADRAAAALADARSYESAVASRRLAEEVLAIVAHDLRAPLNVMKLTAGLLARRDPNAPEPKAMLRAIARAESLVGDLLLTARVDERRLPVQLHPERIAELVADATELQQPTARQREISLVAESPPDLPLVAIDRHRIAQVLANLIANALQYTPSGGHVTVSARAAPGGVCIDVADDGVGMDEETRAHAFDRFWQAAHAHRAGAGLGLAIAKGIVDEHGGQLRVRSAPGEGSTFTVELRRDPRAKS